MFVGRVAFFACVFFAFAVTGADAEVCDKFMGDHWRPEDGPAGRLGPGVALLLLGGLLAAMRLPWVGYVGAALLISYAALLMFVGHPLYQDAVREGCISVALDVINAGLYCFLAFAYWWLGYRTDRSAVRHG